MSTLDRRSRLLHALDALTLSKLFFTVAAFVVWQGSPLFPLGALFMLPVIAAAGVFVLRLFYRAFTGRSVGFGAINLDFRRSRARLDEPLGDQVIRNVLRINATRERDMQF